MKILPINTKSKHYNIYIGNNIIKNLNNILIREKINFEKCLVVVDKKVPKLFLKILKSKIINKKSIIYFFDASEKNKNLNYANSITEKLFVHNFNRSDALICLGGGIAGDVAGFAASIYKRGIKFINIPSTLLSQVDSSIGGKTGVNNKFGKNLIGSFYQPDLVISDTKLLHTLPKREIICGYAEILKHSIIKSRKLFLFLDKNFHKVTTLKKVYIEKAILESCRIKKQIVEQDEKEKSLRKSLNLGHTFGHAYESAMNYSKNLNHGEAVLYGILSATKFSMKIKVLNKNDYQLIFSHLSKLNFTNLKNFFTKRDLNKIVSFMIADKKNITKNINIITIKKIGKVGIDSQFNSKKIKKFIEFELLK